MNQAMHDLLVCDSYWIPRWDDGQARWMERETCFLAKFSSSGLPFLEPNFFLGAWSLVLIG
jgi:hypothetical protein